jgi:N6-L-threonylcarbamoyladenine synthase
MIKNRGKETIILAMETSCDDTSVAVVAEGRKILSNLTSSQIDFHCRFGGVVPEIASRKHLEALSPMIQEALDVAGLTRKDLDAVAVAYGPGLVGALLVGVATAKAFAYGLAVPLIPVNHIMAHIYANFLIYPQISFPLVALVVSGGHSSLLYLEGHGRARVIGKTVDDAAGEAFDKIARALKLGYPGGPIIDRLSHEGNPRAIDFPRAYLDREHRFDFSFSGLKSAALNYINSTQQKGVEVSLPDMAASFQAAVVEVLVHKALDAAEEYNVDTLLLAGGVAANGDLRDTLLKKGRERDLSVYIPPLHLCTDNAPMVAAAAYPLFLQGIKAPLDLNAIPQLSPERMGT